MIGIVTITRSGDEQSAPSWVPMDQLVGRASVGAEVMVIEGYTGRLADGRVAEIDSAGKRVRIEVNWATLRAVEDEAFGGAGAGGPATEPASGQPGGKALTGAGSRWSFRRTR